MTILTTLLPAAKIPPKAWPWTTAPMYDGGNFPANPDKPPWKKNQSIIHQISKSELSLGICTLYILTYIQTLHRFKLTWKIATMMLMITTVNKVTPINPICQVSVSTLVITSENINSTIMRISAAKSLGWDLNSQHTLEQ